MNSNAPMTLMEVFSALKDVRDEAKCRHKLIDIVIIAIAAVICGADDLTGIEAFGKAKIEWFKRFLALDNGIPSHDTFGRVLSLLSPKAFQACFREWVESVRVIYEGKESCFGVLHSEAGSLLFLLLILVSLLGLTGLAGLLGLLGRIISTAFLLAIPLVFTDQPFFLPAILTIGAAFLPPFHSGGVGQHQGHLSIGLAGRRRSLNHGGGISWAEPCRQPCQ